MKTFRENSNVATIWRIEDDLNTLLEKIGEIIWSYLIIPFLIRSNLIYIALWYSL